MLTNKIHQTKPDLNEPEDILSSSLGVIFPDDITNQHGDPTTPVIYLSPSFGPLYLTLADPIGETSRQLFSHFLWNASVLLAEYIEEGSPSQWGVQGERVLELGAGTGLAGMVACLKGAEEVVVSDYPAEEVLLNIRLNVTRNITDRKEAPLAPSLGKISVEGHGWGDLTTPFSLGNKGKFSRILVADCLWMPYQHANLRASIAHFLGQGGKAWVIAGFHTGREKMRGFFAEAELKSVGLGVERIWERNAGWG
ncbi:hypothetical protein G7Y89_g11167 [Cudoniella acicularis]|uniref:Nicotinamide N-methyltransferase n=1 Tax=Cudoniella acicularis TaxID=354080 RepID=A0A8H4RBC3_9HELO|nr:hypothetical protein G7Y89_g11167 [Cudoniella acicularis]